MLGGFLAVGTPEALVDALVARGTRDLAVICNDSGFPGRGVGKLIASRQLRKLVASYVGSNPECARQVEQGGLELELVPQGTLAERIRAGGSGLGGVVTPTGVGTVVEEGKQKVEIGGREYLIELPLRADVALIAAEVADDRGNLVYSRSARNFNPLMAMAADTVIALAKRVVPAGEIDPDRVMTPGVLVRYLVLEG
jgi:acetate CoA/acetoacetate CoA-transferase alpha subunit